MVVTWSWIYSESTGIRASMAAGGRTGIVLYGIGNKCVLFGDRPGPTGNTSLSFAHARECIGDVIACRRACHCLCAQDIYLKQGKVAARIYEDFSSGQ